MDGGKSNCRGGNKEFTIHNVGLIIFMNVKITKNYDIKSGVEKEDGELGVKRHSE